MPDLLAEARYAALLASTATGALAEHARERLDTLKAAGVDLAKFNPTEPRVPGGPHGGEWTATGAIKDALKLAERADLAPGEKLAGSGKVGGDYGTVRMAVVDHDGARSLRLGIGGPLFGGRGDETGPWRAGPDRTAALNAERAKLRDEREALEQEWDHPGTFPGRKEAIYDRLDELDNTDLDEVYASGYTASLDPDTARQLHTTLAAALDEAKRQADHENALYDHIQNLEVQRARLRYMGRTWTDEEDALWDTLTWRIKRTQAELDESERRAAATFGGDPKDGYVIFAEGSVPGRWADVHYRVDLDDRSVGLQLHLGAVPHDVPDLNNLSDLGDGEQDATFDAAEAAKVLRLLDQYTGDTRRSA